MFTYPGMLLLHSELGEHISEHTNFAEFISAGSLWEAYFSSFLTPELFLLGYYEALLSA